MKEVIIGTFNLRNHYWQRNWSGQSFPDSSIKNSLSIYS